MTAIYTPPPFTNFATQREEDYAHEINQLRNVIQSACIGGLEAMAESWARRFPDAGPLSLPGKAPLPLKSTRVGRVYIAGPMTGLPDLNFPAFNALAAELRAQGLHVENPAEHGVVEGATWADYMHFDLTRIATCEAVHLLPGWSKSKGARLEVRIAVDLGMELRYAEGTERYQPAGALALPPAVQAIAERLHTQDNRITAHPLFAVRQKRVIGGLDADYADKFSWLYDGTEVDEETAARLDAMRDAGEPIPPEYQRIGYIEKREFVTGCLTEQGCKDYIAANGHNLNDPDIYAYGGYRNREWQVLREWLMSLVQVDAAMKGPQQ